MIVHACPFPASGVLRTNMTAENVGTRFHANIFTRSRENADVRITIADLWDNYART